MLTERAGPLSFLWHSQVLLSLLGFLPLFFFFMLLYISCSSKGSRLILFRFCFTLLLCIYIMSLSKLSSGSQSMEQSGNLKRPMTTPSMPVACRVCDRVFPDNISLVFHFESHFEDESQYGRSMAALQRSWHLPCSCSDRKNEAHHVEFSRVNCYSAPCPFPVCSPKPPNVLHSKPNAMPPVTPSSDAHLSHKSVASSSTHPIIHSQIGARRSANGLGMVAPLQLNKQNGGPDSKKRRVNQLEKPMPEIIIISDDEGDDKTIDLTLKL